MRSFPPYTRLIWSEIDSTHLRAAGMARRIKLKDRTLLVAEYQHAGKGRFSRKWESEKGKNLLFSLYLDNPGIAATDGFLLIAALSLSICDALAREAIQGVCIKWPNDILCRDKKIAGILIKSGIRGKLVSDVILSCGINVNQIDFGHVTTSAASLKLLSGREFDLRKLERTILGCLEKRLGQLKGKPAALKEAYEERLWKLNEWAYLKDGGDTEQVKITGIHRDGSLKAMPRDGGKERCYHFSKWRIKWPE